ncbi:MAG: hypothetical protein M3O67_04455 [Bacteroidota bacterium]|nr:hypothetical protein [Bacteroidota bacterium]
MKKYFLIAAGFFILLPGCEVKVNTKGDEKTNSASGKIRNDIDLHAKGLKVTQAFLLYEDGSLVPKDNAAGVNQKILLRLIIENGWKVVNNKVMVGASESIETDDGKVLLNEQDLFQNMPEGVNKEDAGAITISAVITRVDKLYDYFIVKFRLWDKAGNGEVSGSYKLYIK